jgi:hyperosmotically inducible protein
VRRLSGHFRRSVAPSVDYLSFTPEYSMNSFKRISTAFISILLLAAVFGCASTRTADSTGGYFDDSAITAKVQTALINAPGVHSTAISVETFKGVVKLSGFVSSEAQIDAAVSAAQGVAGVKSVDNAMTVKGTQ